MNFLKRSNNDGKSIALKAGMWYVISTIVVRGIDVITTPIFTRIMSTEAYGTVSNFSSWYSLLLPICSLNLSYSIGRAKLDYDNCFDEYIGSMQLLSFLVTAIFCVIAIVFLNPIANFLELSENAVFLLMMYLLAVPAITYKQNGYRYRYQYKQNIAIAWFLGLATVFFSLIFISFINYDKAVTRMLGIVLPYGVLSLCFWVGSLVKRQVKINIEHWKYGFALSVPLIFHTVSLYILSQSDRVFITKICGASYTALYSLVYSYGMIISTLTRAISDGWLPWFHDSYHAGEFESIKKNTRMLVTFMCYIGLACIAFAPEAVAILGGDAYADSVYCVPPIALGIVCQSLYTHYVNIELHLKQTKYVSAATIFAACINLVLNAIMIPKYGYVAAAYTTLFSYMVLMVTHYLITIKVFKVKIYDDKFMFASLLVVFLISALLVMLYNTLLPRYALVGIGFISFIIVFKSRIAGFINKKTGSKS